MIDWKSLVGQTVHSENDVVVQQIPRPSEFQLLSFLDYDQHYLMPIFSGKSLILQSIINKSKNLKT